MSDVFDTPPVGYVRANPGWVVPAATPQKKQVDKLKKENEELRARLDAIEAMLIKKGKK
jgi:cell shape-determining protein MreC